MANVEDLITDIASIVTSSKAGERMTLARIEEYYRSIYNCPLPYHDYGFNCLEKLLGRYPEIFSFSEADGNLLVHTSTRSNITDLISNEKSSKKYSNPNNSVGILFKKHRRKEIKVEPELPVTMISQIVRMMENECKPIDKNDFLGKFIEFSGYELKYYDYGFANEEKLFRYLGDIAVIVKNNCIYRRPQSKQTLYKLMEMIISENTGFTCSVLQDRISELAPEDNLTLMMRREGMVNFVELIYACCNKQITCYDFDLVYPYPKSLNQQRRLFNPIEKSSSVSNFMPNFPPGLNHILIHSVISPSKFFFEILTNESHFSRMLLHEKLQNSIDMSPLLINFKENRICCVEYDGIWYRSKISEISTSRGNEFVKVEFMDHPIQIGIGIRISLPTDRLRFIPPELSQMPAFFHRGALAYTRPVNSETRWSKESCDRFISLVMDKQRTYEAYFVSQSIRSVTIDILSRKILDDNYDDDEDDDNNNNNDDDIAYVRESVFHRLIDEDLAEFVDCNS